MRDKSPSFCGVYEDKVYNRWEMASELDEKRIKTVYRSLRHAAGEDEKLVPHQTQLWMA